jgi:cytochrome c553
MIDKRIFYKRMKHPSQSPQISSFTYSCIQHSFVLLFTGLIHASNLYAEPVRFSRDVLPILTEHCIRCHGPDAQARKADLRLDLEEAAVGEASAPIIRGQSDESEFIRRIMSEDPDEVMPPTDAHTKLSKSQIALLKQWIDEGAAWGGHWAFEPVRKPNVPNAGIEWALNDVDRFIAANYEKTGIQPVADAARRTLIRRVTFDLTGLPPTVEEVDAFLRESDKDKAYAELIERLLASSAYGEHWGRHWLDVARYADTAGDNPDYPIPQAWRYRNYVIDAFNKDKPYDQFLREQIAGDLLPAENDDQRQEQLVATGFIALSRRFGGGMTERVGNLTIEDTLDTLGRATMGLTMSCARCHDHKFDPIPTRDYCALYGFFESTVYPSTRSGMNTTVPLLTPEARAQLLGDLAEPIAKLDAKIESISREIDKLTGMAMPVKEKEAELEVLEKEIAKLKKTLPEMPDAYAVIDDSKPKNATLQIRGEQQKKGEQIPRGFLQILGGQKLPEDAKGSGRVELANWIVSPDNPLTARVIVNRIWHYHFGRGLVPTTSDFGTRGTPPSHPDLLDWLADRMVEEKWSIKQMHRLIMLSRTYQLSADDSSEAFQRDPNNTLLWRFERKKLNAEETRDAMMFVSGKLKKTQPTRHPFPPISKKLTEHEPFRDTFPSEHRSVYVMQQRNRRHPYFEVFDGANTNACTGERDCSITPLQALFQINSPEIFEWANAAVDKIPSNVAASEQVQKLYRIILARDATEEEVASAVEYLSRFKSISTTSSGDAIKPLASIARALFASNEFMFIE